MSAKAPPSTTADAPRAFAWAAGWRPVLLLIAALTTFRLAWLMFFSDITLIEDEAHYWEWSRRLGWSYATKGPGVAWAIAASTALLGHTELAVRLPAVLSAVVSTLAVAGLTRRTFDDDRAPFFAAAVWQCLPVVGVVGVLMTIDGPYLACWAVACWAWVSATRAARAWAWPVCGLALGLGFLFKYTILLLALALALDWLVCRRQWTRTHGARTKLAGLALALLALVPVLIWNAQHDWATVRHLLGHLGLPGGEVTGASQGWSYSPVWTLEFLALQVAVAGPAIALMLAGLLTLRRERRAPPFLLIAAAPVFLFYLLVTLFTEAEGNWAVAGFVSLCPVAGWMVARARERNLRGLRVTWGATCVLGLAILLGLPGAQIASRLPALGDKIPTNRISGARAHAAAVQSLIDRVERQTGQTPFVVTGHYGRASQLAFYLPGRPVTYCAADQLGGSSRQYAHWPETDLSNPDTVERLRGRPAIILTGGSPEQRLAWGRAFGAVSDVGRLDADPKRDWTAMVALNFRGFAPTEPARDNGAARTP